MTSTLALSGPFQMKMGIFTAIFAVFVFKSALSDMSQVRIKPVGPVGPIEFLPLHVPSSRTFPLCSSIAAFAKQLHHIFPRCSGIFSRLLNGQSKVLSDLKRSGLHGTF